MCLDKTRHVILISIRHALAAAEEKAGQLGHGAKTISRHFTRRDKPLGLPHEYFALSKKWKRLMKVWASLLLLATIGIWGGALADDARQEGKWRGSGGAAVSISSGNTRSSSINLTADVTRMTSDNKLTLNGQILGSSAKSNGIATTTANLWIAGTRYDHNISAHTFGFGGLAFNHDQLKQLSLRSVVEAGLGYHLIKTNENQFDILGGFSYRADQYSGSGILIDNQMVTTLEAVELRLSEESTHKFSKTVNFKQTLTIYPNLSSSGNRATFNTGLFVSLNKTLSLSVTLQDRYDSLAPAPIMKNDILFFTGVNFKFSE
jgi:putative salt-induced outer membrane protein